MSDKVLEAIAKREDRTQAANKQRKEEAKAAAKAEREAAKEERAAAREEKAAE
jgi:hypothetical protein